MTDMLVRLYALPGYADSGSLVIRHPFAWEKDLVTGWVEAHFSKDWAREAAVAFAVLPVSAYIAVRDGTLAGFACYDCTCRNFFGPMGVAEAHRKQGIGRALLLKTLWRMRDDGYGYAIIGGVGPAVFYEKTVGAQIISGSTPGIYGQILKPIG
ncbi:MAG: GNAT family N-acetyltransferase [Pseudomonadota bacterium]